MQLTRPAFALDPKSFGRGRVRELSGSEPVAPAMGSELKLFATTFLAGFLFVSILIA